MSLSTSPWRSRTWAVRTAFLAISATLGAAGCYNPTFTNPFKCNAMYKAGSGDCPDGFHCSAGLCIRGAETPVEPSVEPPPDARVEVHPDAAADTKPDVVPEAQPDVPQVCNMPVTGCAPVSGGKCDPVCQTGCAGCHEKCSANTSGALTCNVPLNSRPRALGESCDVS